MTELRTPFLYHETVIHDDTPDTYFSNHIFSWYNIDSINLHNFPHKKYEVALKSGTTIGFKDEIDAWLHEMNIEVSIQFMGDCGEDGEFVMTFDKEEDAILFKMTWM